MFISAQQKSHWSKCHSTNLLISGASQVKRYSSSVFEEGQAACFVKVPTPEETISSPLSFAESATTMPEGSGARRLRVEEQGKGHGTLQTSRNRSDRRFSLGQQKERFNDRQFPASATHLNTFFVE